VTTRLARSLALAGGIRFPGWRRKLAFWKRDWELKERVERRGMAVMTMRRVRDFFSSLFLAHFSGLF